jgi:multimeric flavodoxin WrbA
MTEIAIIHHSMYGHVATLSEAIKKGIEDAGVECQIFRVPETLPDKVEKLGIVSQRKVFAKCAHYLHVALHHRLLWI